MTTFAGKTDIDTNRHASRLARAFRPPEVRRAKGSRWL